MWRHLTCCSNPRLEMLKDLLDKSHDSESVKRCTSCGAHWFHWWHEEMNFDGGSDENTDWFSRLSDEEARMLLGADGPPELGFLGLRPAICIDLHGAQEGFMPPWHWKVPQGQK